MKICTARKIVLALCSMVVMLALMAGTTAILSNAASNGIYIATANPHYKHPITGEMEDPGQNPGIGQGMTESATHKKALVEVDEKGNTFITIRLQLMDNIENPRFQVDGKPVKATCTQEKYGDKSIDNTADFRMKVNSEKSVIRCNVFVTAMGRDVIYYVTVSNLKPGHGDFIPSIKVTNPTETPSQEEISTSEESNNPSENSKPSETENTEASIPSSNPTDPVNPGKDDSEVVGLQEFDSSGNKIEQQETKTDSASSNTNVVIWILCGVAAAAAVAFCIWYFGFFKKKKK